jgi:hypothetical protein
MAQAATPPNRMTKNQEPQLHQCCGPNIPQAGDDGQGTFSGPRPQLTVGGRRGRLEMHCFAAAAGKSAILSTVECISYASHATATILREDRRHGRSACRTLWSYPVCHPLPPTTTLYVGICRKSRGPCISTLHCHDEHGCASRAATRNKDPKFHDHLGHEASSRLILKS